MLAHVTSRYFAEVAGKKGQPMPQNVDLKYIKAMDAFVRRLNDDLQKAAEENEDNEYSAIVAYPESGRKYDKVLVATIKKGSAKATAEVRYFVDRENGTIYGKKSEVAPHEEHWYGTIYSAKDWGWGGHRAEPKPSAKVREVRKYGVYTIYAPEDEKVAVGA